MSVDLLSQVRVAKLSRSNVNVWLYSSPLGQACFRLDRLQVEDCLTELRRSGLLEQGFLFTSELRPLTGERDLDSREKRQFQAEIGCPPLLLTCHGCGHELHRLREASGNKGDQSGSQKEKEVQTVASHIVELLLQSGARMALQDVGPQGNTALHLAARYGAPQLLSSLLRMGASVSDRNKDGSSAEVLAERAGRTMCVQILQVAAMIELQRTSAEVKEMAEQQDRASLKKKRVKERQREKEKQESFHKESDKDAGRRGDGSSPEKRDDGHEGPRAAYGLHNMWSALHEDHCVDDAELPDEWNEENWGEYLDWGEDWDVEGEEEDGKLSDGDDDDEDEVRAELLRLRKEKAAQLQQIYSFAVEREERMQKAEALREEASRLGATAKRMEERVARVKAGDQQARDDFAAEAEVSAWWEERAAVHARSVAQLEIALSKQKKVEEEALAPLRLQAREAERKMKGLEEYWYGRCAAVSGMELLARLEAENHFTTVVKDLGRITDLLEISPELKARLPPFVLESATHEGGLPYTLPSAATLMATAQAHQAIHGRIREQQPMLSEMLDACNKLIVAKDEEILETVEKELCRRVLPKASMIGKVSGAKEWARVSELIAHTQQVLEQKSSSSGAFRNADNFQREPQEPSNFARG